QQPTTFQDDTLSLHDALPILNGAMQKRPLPIASVVLISRSSLLSSLFRRHIEKMPLQQVVMRLIGLKKLCRYGKKSIGKMVHNRSEEHTSELQSRFDLVCRLI